MPNTPKIGELSTNTALLGRRDAHHVAAILVTSVRTLHASDAVKFCDSRRTIVEFADTAERQAVVDPFIQGYTAPGQLFWVLLVPELVSGLHHEFDIGVPVASFDPGRDEGTVYYRDDCGGRWCEDH